MKQRESRRSVTHSKRAIWAAAFVLALAAPRAIAGNLFLTGHDIDFHNGQNGYDTVILEYLRCKDTPLEIPSAQYKIAVLRTTGTGGWRWSDTALVQKPGYGLTTEYDPATLTPAGWASMLSTNDVLVITSHTSCGGCSLTNAGVNAIFANRAQIQAAFDAGLDIWANAGATNGTYYNFLPPAFAVAGPPLTPNVATGFMASGPGTNMGIIDTGGGDMTSHQTHNTFAGISPSLIVMETLEDATHPQNHAVISLGARNLRFKSPCPMPSRSQSAASTLDHFSTPDATSIPVPERAAFATFVGASRQFDALGPDAALGHSFVGLPIGIIDARLVLRMRPEDDTVGAENESDDTVSLQFDDTGGTFAWTHNIGLVGTTAGLVALPWTVPGTYVPAGATISLDLGQLPLVGGGTLDLLPSLNVEHHLDVYIEDDTNVDWMRLDFVLCPCATPPKSMVAWYQFDDPATLDNEPDAAGGTLATRMPGGAVGPTRVLGQHVDDCLEFHDNNPDTVRVNNPNELNFGSGSFSIDAWIRMAGNTSGFRTIADKRSYAGPSGNPVGYRFYVRDGYLGCTLADASLPGQTEYQSTDATAAAKLLSGQWHHVAMTVERGIAPKIVTLYVDATPIAQFSALGKLGSVSSTNVALIGNGYAISGSNSNPFDHFMDEVEFFNRAITQADVSAIFAAGRNGKCKEACYLSYPHSSVVIGGSVGQLLICNFSSNTQTYNWSVAGLASGPGCNLDGTGLVFTPASGTVTVPARKCVAVSFGVNTAAFTCTDIACIETTLINLNSGMVSMCTGRVYRRCFIDIDMSTQSLQLLGRPGQAPAAPVSFGVMNTGLPSGMPLPYTLQVIDSRDGLPSGVVSLNGLPPGTSVTGTLSLPTGGATTIPGTVEFLDFDAFAVHELEFRADLDGDGVQNVLVTMPLLSNPALDCDANGVSDQEDILAGAADCDTNGVPDGCDIASGASPDCNANAIPDACDIASGTSTDANGNGIPDSCEGVTSFCFGDGTLTDHTSPCPCANDGAPGNGCANSVNPAGANLAATGTPNPDTMVLVGTGMPATVSSIFLQGDAQADAVFGDGTRCTGGVLIRLRTKVNVGGASSFPDSADTISLSVRGGVTPGSGAMRYYQTYYRNSAAAFCPPATFNVTNGVVVTW